MKNDIECRKPFGIVNDKGKETAFHYITGKSLYKFDMVNSNLLIAIDNDNVNLMKLCLKKGKIGVNQQYVIPSWEVPEADCPYRDTFLHRAIFAGSEKCFKALLTLGADPKKKNYLGIDVYDAADFEGSPFKKLLSQRADIVRKVITQKRRKEI